MTIRRTIPYLLIHIFFVAIYWLTMIIPNKTLYLGFWADSNEVIFNNKIPLHSYIFVYGLTLLIIALNFLEVISTTLDKFWLRLLKSTLTILFIYLFCFLINKQLNTSIWNLYFYPRGAPGNFWCMMTIFITTAGITILEGLKKLYLFKFDKYFLCRFIPHWLRLERSI
jgi:hypothetical protein